MSGYANTSPRHTIIGNMNTYGHAPPLNRRTFTPGDPVAILRSTVVWMGEPMDYPAAHLEYVLKSSGCCVCHALMIPAICDVASLADVDPASSAWATVRSP